MLQEKERKKNYKIKYSAFLKIVRYNFVNIKIAKTRDDKESNL